MLRQIYHVHNYEIVVFPKVINGENRIFVAANTKGTTVLHWGVCKSSPREWLFNRDAKEVVLWLLVEISRREKEAERSLMHRFNISTDMTDRCKREGERGLIGILVWMRFMACRHLTWNKNFNVKPREISEAQDRFTSLLQIIYLNQPSNKEIVRLIMMCVGPGGQGDAGQRIRDDILLIQRNNDCKTGMMEEWHQKLHNICQKAKLNHENICMTVLIQEVICGDYAFIIHTKNPLSGDATEIYAEIVKGLGETLVGAYPGRAMTFIVKKANLKSPVVTSYPSKLTGLYSKKSIIFRSDSNAEDLEGFSGAGLFDSVIMDKVEKVVLDYSKDSIIADKPFQTSLFSRIAEAGKILEDLHGFPQDIEGVVKDGTIFVVQARPQI